MLRRDLISMYSSSRSRSRSSSSSNSSFNNINTNNNNSNMIGITTPGWRVIEMQPMSQYEYEHVTRPHERENTLLDDVYIRRHRLIELRERHSLLVYDLKRERKKRRRASSSRPSDLISIQPDDDLIVLPENASIEELEEVIARLEQFIRLSSTPPPTTIVNSRRERRKRHSSRSVFNSSSSSSSSSSSRNNSSSSGSDGSCSAGESAVSPQPTEKICSVSRKMAVPTTLQLMTSNQARQIKNLTFSKLKACSFTQQDMLELAENNTTTKRIKLEERVASSWTPSSTRLQSSSASLSLASSSSTSSSSILLNCKLLPPPQLKQIENIEKSTIEISLSQGKILRTTKQAMDKPPLDLIRSSYCTFYRRIN